MTPSKLSPIRFPFSGLLSAHSQHPEGHSLPIALVSLFLMACLARKGFGIQDPLLQKHGRMAATVKHGRITVLKVMAPCNGKLEAMPPANPSSRINHGVIASSENQSTSDGSWARLLVAPQSIRHLHLTIDMLHIPPWLHETAATKQTGS